MNFNHYQNTNKNFKNNFVFRIDVNDPLNAKNLPDQLEKNPKLHLYPNFAQFEDCHTNLALYSSNNVVKFDSKMEYDKKDQIINNNFE